jgi:hypothetical protein
VNTLCAIHVNTPRFFSRLTSSPDELLKVHYKGNYFATGKFWIALSDRQPCRQLADISIPMKNNHAEYLKRRAKDYHRVRRGDCFQGGMLIFHDYAGLPPARLTWWDDVTFTMNDYRVALAWRHPRTAYEDAIDTEVDRLTANLPHENILRKGTPVYLALGKSRKKIIHTVYEPRPKSDWLENWQRARQQVMQSANVEIRPSLNARWCRYSRLVHLCAPLEVRDEGDLSRLVALIKRLLKRELTLSEAFPGYRYTRDDWERENLHVADTDLHIHKLSP